MGSGAPIGGEIGVTGIERVAAIGDLLPIGDAVPIGVAKTVRIVGDTGVGVGRVQLIDHPIHILVQDIGIQSIDDAVAVFVQWIEKIRTYLYPVFYAVFIGIPIVGSVPRVASGPSKSPSPSVSTSQSFTEMVTTDDTLVQGAWALIVETGLAQDFAAS